MNIFDPHITGSLSVSASANIQGDLVVGGTIYGTAQISGQVQNAISASHASSYLLTSSFETYTGSAATTGSNTFIGDQTISGSLLPQGTLIHDLGSDSQRWRDIYLAGNTINLGGTKITKDDDGNVEIKDSTNTLKKIVASEIEVGTGSGKKVIKVVNGKLKLTDTADTKDEAAQLSGSFTGSFVGDGARLTNVPASAVTGLNLARISNTTATASISNAGLITNVSVIPDTTDAIDLGSPTKQWRDLYLSSGSLYINGQQVLSTTGTELRVTTDSGESIKILETGSDTITLQTVDGDITLTASGNGNIELDAPIQIAAGKKILSSDGNSIQFGNGLIITGSIELSGNVDGVDIARLKTDVDAILAGSTADKDSFAEIVQLINSVDTTNDQAFAAHYTASNNRFSSIESTTSSFDGRLDSLETKTGSLDSVDTTQNSRLTALETKTGSLNTDISGLDGRIDSLETESGSIRGTFNSYTSSNNNTNSTQNSRLSSLESFTGSIDNTYATDADVTSLRGTLNSYTSSNNNRNSTQDGRLDSIESFTSSINDTYATDQDVTNLRVDFNSYTASNNITIGNIAGDISTLDGRVDSLETESGSIRTAFNTYTSSNNAINTTQNSKLSSIESTTGSFAGRLSSLEIKSGSVDVLNSSQNSRLSSLESFTGSIDSTYATDSDVTNLRNTLNSYTSSNDNTNSTQNGRLGLLETESGSIRTAFNSYTSSNDGRNATQDGRLNTLESFKTTISSYTASNDNTNSTQNSRLSSLETTSGSHNTRISTLESFKTTVNGGLEFTGSNVTIKGDLLVKGTQTTVNSTTVEISDNIISLNGSGAANAGIEVRDMTSPGLLSGSLLWDGANNYWVGGPKGSEERILTNTDLTTLDGRLDSLETESGSVRTTLNSYTSSNDNRNATQDGRLNSIETKTGSLESVNTAQNGRLGSLETESGSIRTAFNTYTSSNDSTNSTQDGRLNSLESSRTSLNSFTSSAGGRISSLESFTGSIDATYATDADVTTLRNTLNSYTSSNDGKNSTQDGRLNSLESSRTSLNSFTSSASGRLSSIETVTGSFDGRLDSIESFTGSLDATYATDSDLGLLRGTLNSYTSSNDGRNNTQDGRLNSLESSRTSLNSFTSSASGRLSSIETTTGSFDGRLDSIESFTGSLDATYATDSDVTSLRTTFNTYTGSNNSTNNTQNNRLSSLETKTGSLNNDISLLDGRLDSIESNTGSYLTQHPTISAAGSSNNSGRTYIQDILLDSNGHVTGLTTGTETVVNTDRYVTGATFNSSNADLTLTRNDGNSVTVRLLDTLTDVTVTGGTYNSGTQTLRLTKSDGNTVDVSGFAIDTDVNWYTTGATFNTSTGVITGTHQNGTWTVDIDGRYLPLDGGTITKTSTHVSQTAMSSANAHLDLYNDWQSDTDQKGSILTFTDNYYDGSNYNKTLRAAIKGGTDTTGNTADGYLEFYTDSAGANSPNLVLRLDKNKNATFSNIVYAAGGNSGQWNLAYAWGDHGTRGYLTAHPSVSAASSSNNSGRTYIQDILLDSFGHITGITTGTETVTNTDTNYYVTGATFNTGDGVITFTRNDGSTVTVDIDGRFTDNGYADAMNQHVRTSDSPTFVSTTLTSTLTAPTIQIGNTSFSRSGDQNHVHFVGTALIPNTTTTSSNSSMGTSAYRWSTVYGGYGNFSNSVTANAFAKIGGTSSQFLMADGSVSTNPGWLTSHPSVSAASSSNNSGRTYIQDILLDSFGHITGITTGTETVTNTDTNYYTTGVTWNGTTATLTFTRNNGGTYNVQMLETLSDVTVTGGTYNSGTQTLRLTKSDGSTVDVSGFAVDTDVNWYTTGATFNTSNGIITGTRNDGGTWTVDIDGKYSELGHTHDDRYYTESESDSRFVNVVGDTMSGTLNVNAPTGINLSDSGNNATFHQFESYWNTNAGSSIATYRFDVGTFRIWSVGTGSSVFQISSAGAVSIPGTLGVTGNFTTSGTVTASGGNSSQWNTAYGWGDHSTRGYLTSYTDTNNYTTGATFNTSNGVITFTRNDGGTYTVDIDGKYAEASHSHNYIGTVSTVSSSYDFDSLYADNQLRFHSTYANSGSWTGASITNYPTTPTATAYAYGITLSAKNTSQGSLQVYAPHNQNSQSDMFFRTGWGTDYKAWARVWTDRNDGAGSGLDADLLDGQQGSYYLNYNNFSNTPTIGNGTMSISAGGGMSGGGSFTANQTGDSTVTISHADTSSQSSTSNSGRTYIQNLSFDGYGHVTGLTTATETVTNTDTNYYTTSAAFNTSTGVITGTRNDGGTWTVDIDGRYLTSYTETDTLQSVTNRGSSTTNNIYINNTNPTLFLQDTDNRSAMVHVNSNYFYILNGSANNSTGWAQQANSRWLFMGNLNTNDITFGGSGDFAGVVTATGGNSSQWNTAYGWGNHASAGYLTSYTDTNYYTTGSTFNSGTGILTFTRNDGGTYTVNIAATLTDVTVTGGTYNSSNQTLTLTKSNGSTVSVSGFAIDTDVNWYTTSASFNTGNGIITGTRNDGGTWTVDIDGRYAYTSHTHDDRYYTETESDARYPLSRGSIGTSSTPGDATGFGNNLAAGTYTRNYTGHSGQMIMSHDTGGSVGNVGIEVTYSGDMWVHTNIDSSSWGTKTIWTSRNFTSTNISNWNTAYGWGNHASAGYLTSYSETDTLATVTSRGSSTSTALTLNGALTLNNTLSMSTSSTQPVTIYGDSAGSNGLFRIQIDSVSDSFGSGARTFLGDGGIDVIIGTSNGSYTPNNSYISINHNDSIFMGAGSSPGLDFILDTSGNVTLVGSITVSGGNSSQWNTAYNKRVTSTSLSSSTLTIAAADGTTVTATVPTFNQSTTGNAATATLASTVSINYSNDSNSTYQMLWGSGNSVYGTGGVYLNPSTDYVYATSFNASDWFRSSGTTGWYNSTYGGGWYMTDTSYVRPYNSKSIHMGNASIDYVTQLHFNDNVRFYDEDNNNYLNYKWGNSGAGGIKFRDGDDSIQGYVYGSGTGSFGLLDGSGNWKIRLDTSDVEMYGTQYLTTIYANTIYDRNDSNYYLNPNGSSRLYGLTLAGNANGTDSVNQLFLWSNDGTTSAIGFKANGGEFGNPTGNGDGYNTYFTMDTDGRGWVFRRGSGGSDFNAAYTSGWILNNGIWQANASMRAPIFYDSNDTSYYLDPNSASNLKTLTLNSSGAGSTVLNIQGTSGQLFSITDDLTGDLFAVSDASGVPIFKVNANGTVSIDSLGSLVVGGTITASGYNKTNWDTAYGWGNHASAGYLTSFDITTQTDGKYLRSDVSDTHSATLTVNGQFIFNSSLNSSYREGIRLNLSTTGWGGAVFGGVRDSISGITEAWWVARNPSKDFVISYGTSGNEAGLYLPHNSSALTYKNYRVWNAADFANNSSNWDTAYGWGNHASAGYASSSHNHSGVYLPIGGKAADSELLDGLDSSAYVRRDTTGQFLKPYQEYGSYISNTTLPNSLVSDMGGGGLRVDFLNGAPFGTWAHTLTFSGYNGYNMYQLAGHYKGSGGEGPTLYVRSEPNHAQNSWSTWKKIAFSNSTSFTNTTTVSFTHGIGHDDVIVQVFDSGGSLFFPSEMRVAGGVVTVSFEVPRSGKLVVVG